MLHRLVLLVCRSDDVGMTMPHADGHNPAEAIQVTSARFVPYVLHFPLHEHDRFFVIEENSRIHELLALGEYFCRGRAGVLMRLMTCWRQRDFFHEIFSCYIILAEPAAPHAAR